MGSGYHLNYARTLARRPASAKGKGLRVRGVLLLMLFCSVLLAEPAAAASPPPALGAAKSSGVQAPSAQPGVPTSKPGVPTSKPDVPTSKPGVPTSKPGVAAASKRPAVAAATNSDVEQIGPKPNATIWPVTVVSGYWQISGKNTPKEYDAWFRRTLKLNGDHAAPRLRPQPRLPLPSVAATLGSA